MMLLLFAGVLIFCVALITSPAWAIFKTSSMIHDDEFNGLCLFGTEQQVRDAIKAGAEWDKSALISATRNSPEVVAALLEDGPDNEAKNVALLRTCSDSGVFLRKFAETFAPKIVKMLLDAGAEVDARDDEDNTALILASQCAPSEVVKILIDAGADVNARGGSYHSPILAASKNENPDLNDVFDLLIKAGADTEKYKKENTLLMEERASNIFLCAVINAGIYTDINVRDDFGRTVLMTVTDSGFRKPDVNLIELLLKAGADVNATDDSGWTALMHYADNTSTSDGSPAVIRLLAENGADVNVQDNHGKTALIIAAEHNPDVINALLEAGADVNIKDMFGRRAADYARKKDYLKNIDEMIRGVTRLEELSSKH